jgi:ribonuclease HI
MIFALLTSLCCSVIILLRFDGSLTPPSDAGCAKIPARLAVCSTSIALSLTFSSKQCGDIMCMPSFVREAFPLAVGSRSLELTMGMTSAHSEYEGLLLGLEWLVKGGGATLWDNSTLIHSLQYGEAVSLPPKIHQCVLVIQGDCRTVIDQLSGRSAPRKLRPLYDKSQDLIQKLLQLKKEALLISRIEYQHIPRHENIVCDGICCALKAIITRNSETALSQALRIVSIMENKEATGDASQFRIRSIISQHLAPSTSFIRFSVRPPFYKTMAALAERHGEWETLVEIGLSMTTDARQIWPMLGKLSSPRSEFEALGVMFQIRGLESMNRVKQASALRRKHRSLLDELPRIAQQDGIASSYGWELPGEIIPQGKEGGLLLKDDAAYQVKINFDKGDRAVDWNPILERWLGIAEQEGGISNKLWIERSNFL